MKKIIIFFIILLRTFVAALPLLIDPIAAILIDFLIDAWDSLFMKKVLKMSRLNIYFLDKTLDFLFLIGLEAAVFRSDMPIKLFLLFLFVYRAIAHIIFYFNRNFKIFIYFPNFFEFFTLFFLAVYKFKTNISSFDLFWVIPVSFLIIFFKIWNEYMLHKNNYSVYDSIFLPFMRNLKYFRMGDNYIYKEGK